MDKIIAKDRTGAIRVRKIFEIEYKEKMADSTWNVACI